MSNQIYWLSREDVLALRQLVDDARIPKNRHTGIDSSDADYPSPDIYVVRTPASGIAAMQSYGTGTGSATEESIGYAYCQIYRVLQSTNALDPPNTFILQAVSNLNQYVYSLFSVAGDTWVPVGRDKFGTWFVLGSNTTALQWVKVTSATPQTIYLGRKITDAVENSTTTLTSASANFTSADVGATLIGANIPTVPPTVISSVTNNTTIIMSAAATASTSDVTVQIVTGTTTGYPAVIDTWSNKTGAWSDTTTNVWWIGVNNETPQAGIRYQCRLLGTDDNNEAIWATINQGNTIAWVTVTDTTYTTINLGRIVTDADIQNGSFTLTSNSANFTSSDVGAILIGSGIPLSATISGVTNSTTITMSGAATATITGDTVQIVTGRTRAYGAVISPWDSKKGTWGSGTSVWIKEANEGVLQQLTRYQARLVGTDDNNIQVWMTSIPNSWLESQAGPTALTPANTWVPTGISVSLPQNTIWHLTAQITGDISAGSTSPFGTGDYLQFRFYDVANSKQYGVTATCCYIICAGEFQIDSTPMVAIVQTPTNSSQDPSTSKDIVVEIQGMVVTTTSGSTGNMELSILDAIQMN